MNREDIKIEAFTLVETIIAMTLISIIFVMIMQAFSAILLSTYLVDARSSVRSESEFVSEYFKLRIKNADPRSIVCTSEDSNAALIGDYPNHSIYWQNSGSSTSYVFKVQEITGLDGKKSKRFCLSHYNPHEASPRYTTDCKNVLTYNDVTVSDIDISCDKVTDDVTRAEFWIINLNYKMSSTIDMGDKPAVQNVPRHVSISIR